MTLLGKPIPEFFVSFRASCGYSAQLAKDDKHASTHAQVRGVLVAPIHQVFLNVNLRGTEVDE